MPRMLVDATQRDLSVELFGLKLPSPIFMAPIGVLGICAQDGHGDLAAARAAAMTGVPFTLSTLSNDPLEAVAKALGDAPGFFQLYTPDDRELAESFVRRAETAGFKALIVTVDTWVPGWRPRDLNESNFPQLRAPASPIISPIRASARFCRSRRRKTRPARCAPGRSCSPSR